MPTYSYSVLSDILVKEDRGNMHAEWASKVGINLWYQDCMKVVQSIELSFEAKSAM